MNEARLHGYIGMMRGQLDELTRTQPDLNVAIRDRARFLKRLVQKLAAEARRAEVQACHHVRHETYNHCQHCRKRMPKPAVNFDAATELRKLENR